MHSHGIRRRVALDAARVPRIVGNPRVGHTLYCAAAPLATYRKNGQRRYQWKRGGAEISGATNQSYAVVLADFGSTLTVVQTDNDIAIAESTATAAVGTTYPVTIQGAGWTIANNELTATATSATTALEVNVRPGDTYTVAFDLVRTSGTLYASLDAGVSSLNTATSGAKSFVLTAGTANRLWFFGGAISGVISNLTITPVTSSSFLAADSYSIAGSDIAKLSGPLFDNHTLGNIKIGGSAPETRAITYFCATENSAVSTARIFYTATGDANGYASGNGGVIRMRIWPVLGDGITPDESGSHLGESTYTPNLLAGNFQGGMTEHELHTFTGASALTKGTTYAIVYENTAADKDANQISIDCYAHSAMSAIAWAPQAEWGSAFQSRANSGVAWNTVTATDRGKDPALLIRWKPCMELIYANAGKFGSGLIITANIDDRISRCNHAEPARCKIIVATSRAIRGAYIHVSSPHGGEMIWSLTTSGGLVLASGVTTVERTGGDYVYSLHMHLHGLVAFDFGTRVSMQTSETYYLEMRPVGHTEILLAANHDGRNAGYTSRFAKLEHTAERYNYLATAWWSANAYKPLSSSAIAGYPLMLISA